MPDPGDIDRYHRDVRAMLRYWEEKRQGRPMPARADIDPFELKPFLPGIAIIDVVADERRYVYRLVGTREVAMRGRDPTGRSVNDAFYGASAATSLASYDAVVNGRTPLFENRRFVTPDGRSGDEEVVLLPLSDDGKTVTKILAYTHHRLI